MLAREVIVLLTLALAAHAAARAETSTAVRPYVAALQQGQAPVDFVNGKLDQYDLLIFDDAMHTAVEPWRFFAELVRDPRFSSRVKHIFLEIGPLNYQGAIDAYLDSPDDRPALLYPLLQNATDFGWPYQTYFDFFRAVREANQRLPRDRRMRVLATDMPAYWPMMQTRQDWDLNMRSGEARDYHMYAVVSGYLDNFAKGSKGILLTNTRHAYKHIENAKGEVYWNAGTFFHERHPGKTYAIHMHHLALEMKARAASAGSKSREGLDGVTFNWVRMENGLWDCAHQALGYRPLALGINRTPFGQAPYIGNHMLNARAGQTMSDAFDAVVFLGPIEQFRSTAIAPIYTPDYQRELVRRTRVISTEADIARMLKSAGVPTLEAFVEQTYRERPEGPVKQAQSLPPLGCDAK